MKLKSAIYEDELWSKLEALNLVSVICSMQPPNKKKQQQEIRYLKCLQDNITPEQLMFSEKANEDIVGCFLDGIQDLNLNMSRQDLESIRNYVSLTITKLKEHYKRQRPPLQDIELDNDSYPSGHAMSAYCFALVCSYKNKCAIKPLFELAHKISRSRNYIGVHYPSDIVFSFKLTKLLHDNKLLINILP